MEQKIIVLGMGPAGLSAAIAARSRNKSVTVIGTEAFAGCTELEAICIPYATGYIAPDAFDGCASLKHIFYAGPYEDWLRLYGAYMDPEVCIYCADGNFCQGFPIP